MTENGNITPSLGGLSRQTQRLTDFPNCAAWIGRLLVGGCILQRCRRSSSSLSWRLTKCAFLPALTSWIASDWLANVPPMGFRFCAPL